MNTTSKHAAAQLRRLADLFDAAEEAPMTALLLFGVPYHGFQADRVAAVDTLAAMLGLQAAPRKSGSSWEHDATETRDGVRLNVYTHIEAPPQRCICGATCEHGAAVAA